MLVPHIQSILSHGHVAGLLLKRMLLLQGNCREMPVHLDNLRRLVPPKLYFRYEMVQMFFKESKCLI